MNHTKKTKTQLLEEIQRLHQRIHELEMSLKVHQEECIRRVEILETSHDYLQAIIDNIGDPVLVIDPKYHVVLANKKVKELAGGIDPVKTGLFCYQVSHHSDKPCTGKKESCPLKKILKTKSSVTMIHTHYDSAGNKMLVEIIATPILDKKGGVLHIIEVCRDITERKKMEEALRESEIRYRSLFEQSGDAIFLLQANGPEAGKILSANKVACRMHGYTKKELLNLSIFSLHTQESAAKALKRLKRIVNGETLRFEVMHKRKDGTVFPVEVSAALMKIGGKKLILAIDRNISKRRRAEEERDKLIKELKHISRIDGLTGLLNRQYLDKRLDEEIKRAKRYGNPLSMIMFDIDNFKKVNDTYGHLIGDKILQKTAETIKKTLRDTDIAGRFGGDEFVLILVQTDINVGKQVAERLRDRIKKSRVPVRKDQFISFSISTGICQYDNKMKSVDEFISKTDKAMYMAKFSGHNQICEAMG